LYTAGYNWLYRYRHLTPNTTRQYTPYFELWRPAQSMSGDQTTPLSVTGLDPGSVVYPFEPFNYGDGGQMGQVFIRGECIDQYGNALVSCSVEAFVTSSNALAGTTTSDTNGNYACPTPYPSIQHFIVAYYAATNLAGTTIDTLVPTQ
jgi:hypothetical protein